MAIFVRTAQNELQITVFRTLLNDQKKTTEDHMTPEIPRKTNTHRAVQNVTVLTIVFMVSLWGFFAYWSVTTRLETIAAAENDLSQMAHAVEQYSTNLFNMAEIFQVTAERWLDANPKIDPRTDSGFIALIEDFRKRTNNLIDIRMATSKGDLYYFPNDPAHPKDNVADREYFKAVIHGEPGTRYVGIPVISRVSNQWRLPVTVRMNHPHHDLEVINASVNLNSFIHAFESERPQPNGSIGLWNIDGTLLVRAPQVENLFGKQAAEHWIDWERIRTHPTGVFLSEITPIDGAARLIGHAKLKDFPLIVVVSSALSDTLEPWHRQVYWTLGVLVLVTLGVSLFSARLVRALREQEQHAMEMERLATTDSLTGVFNRRQFWTVGMREFARARRYNKPLSLLMLDIDYFKNINDTWGHPTGDRVLQALTEIMASMVRDQDTVGRLGGEEFAVILPETELSGACVIAERMRTEIQKSTMATMENNDGGHIVNMTVSIGIASSSPDDISFDTVLSRADKNHYEAKESGRNRVVAT